VALTPIQTRILRLLASSRTAESYVAGSTPLNVAGHRFSKDVDIFHDDPGAIAAAARADIARLEAEGFSGTLLREGPTFCAARIADGEESTRLEWSHDSDFRFFPAVKDDLFGFRLHMADLATNKVLAAADRHAARDAIDLLTIHRHVLPLGALAWAAAEKNPGLSPEYIIGEIRRTGRYQDYELADEMLSEPLTAAALNVGLRAALDDAEAFLDGLPRTFVELGLFLDPSGLPFQPQPEDAPRATIHHGSRKGAWPTNDDIAREQFIAALSAWPRPTASPAR
jgi:hypothetical protein